jgi:hypothetical protein
LSKHVTGKWEFEVDPLRSHVAGEWVAAMRRRYEREVGAIRFCQGPASDNGFQLDASVAGTFLPGTGQIVLFYSEENDLASLAEELAHYFQYKRQSLIGKTEEEIGEVVINRNELAMGNIMVSHGFRIRR